MEIEELSIRRTPDPYSAEALALAAPRSRTLGVVAALVGVGVFVLSLTASLVMGMASVPYIETGPTGVSLGLEVGTGDPDQDLLAVLVFVHVGLGALVAVWVMGQGILAIVSERGRRYGVVGLVFAFLAPGLSAVIYYGVAFGTYLSDVSQR